MDMGDLIKMGASAFMKSNGSGDAGSGLDLGSLTSALSGLTGMAWPGCSGSADV